MVEVLITTAFTDKYTNKVYMPNERVVMSKERATEIQNFGQGYIAILQEVEEKVETKTKTKTK